MIIKTGYAQYPVNRKLTREERGYQFHQKRQLDAEPFYNLSVIRMNSTYLECVDRWFAVRGIIAVIGVGGFVFFLSLLILPFLASTPIHYIPTRDDKEWFLLFTPLMIPEWLLVGWIMRLEVFRFTHYPIRFNYRNSMVYVFGTNGRCFQAKWDDIFFTLGRCGFQAGRQRWEIRGHILDADRETVRVSFSLPGYSLQTDQLKHGWEFFRRYMDDGPAAVYPDVFWCHDIATGRESFRAGLRFLFFLFNGLPIAQILFSPLFFIAAIGRWFAMRTSKIPAWPAQVEAECTIDPFDPCLRDASMNPAKIPMETIAAARRREQ
jgi:hypothetical protein